MQLTTITARYLRRKQPQQFEPAEAELSATFTAVEGSVISMADASKFYDKALGEVKAAVQAKMGGKPAEVSVEGMTANVKVEVPPATTVRVKPAEAPAPAAEAPKNKGGRPRKDAVKPVEAKPAAKDDDGFEDAPAAPAKVAAPVVDDGFDDPAEAATAATPGDDEFAENEPKPMSPIELQTQLSALVTTKKVAGSDVKAILLKYGAARSADTKEGDRAAILAEVKALIKK
jgi:hypothetical protein